MTLATVSAFHHDAAWALEEQGDYIPYKNRNLVQEALIVYLCFCQGPSLRTPG